MPPARDRAAALLGLLGAAGNVAGVAFLRDVPVAYLPGSLDEWARLSALHPAATAASAVSFVAGLLALAGWALAVGRWAGTRAAGRGAAAAATGAVLNGAGCVAPLVLVLHVLPGCGGEACGPVARALLGVTLSLDALFNLLLGLGLLALGPALWRRGERALGALGLLAGLASVPVALQVASVQAARLLYVAAPLWLLFVLWTSARLFLARAAPSGAAGLPRAA
ncbi:MAG: hypothetical protein HZB56_12075 [Deltaproteobacteria bacterium]|nr:hypothetical protein [Deltaproteobacteria bacterium]